MISCHNHSKIGRNPTFLRIPKVTQNKQIDKKRHNIKKKKRAISQLKYIYDPPEKYELYKAVVLKIEYALKSNGGLVKTQPAGPHPQRV